MNFYNENDPHAAAWLRNLITSGLLPWGHVDDRSIEDVQPSDLNGYDQCHFFAGIGGWPLALALAGVPATTPLWTGSCPCQPFSQAGKGKGVEDGRHLWPAFVHLISACRPAIVFGEQVASPAGRAWLAGVQTEMEALAYQTGAADLCAAGIGAPHIRQRLYWVAESDSERREREQLHLRTGPEGSGVSETRWSRKAGRVADTSGGGSSPRDVQGSCKTCGKGWQARGTASNDCKACRVGDAEARGRQQKCTDTGGCAGGVGTEECKQRSGGDRAACGMGDPSSTRAGGNPGTVSGAEAKGAGEGQHPWDLCDGLIPPSAVIPCADGKVRRLKPGIEPLVDGLPGRVGRLRAYGNAIVPQVAAEFIGAYFDEN